MNSKFIRISKTMPPKSNQRSADNEPPTFDEISAGVSKKQKRHCCFTQFNVDPKPHEYLILGVHYDYILYQPEECPSTGRFHYQGYIQLPNKKHPRLSTYFNEVHHLNPLKYARYTGEEDDEGVQITEEVAQHIRGITFCFSGIWIKECLGSDEHNYKYCLKSGTAIGDPFEDGERRGIDQKFDKAKAERLVSARRFDPMKSIQDQWWYARNLRAIEVVDKLNYDVMVRSRDYKQTKIYILFGITGAGKTQGGMYGKWEPIIERGVHTARCIGYYPEDLKRVFPITMLNSKNNNYPWFDGYVGQKRVWLDEIEKKGVPLSFLLDATQPYCSPFQVKGKSVLRGWTELFIGTNIPMYKLFAIPPKAGEVDDSYVPDPRFDCLKRRLIPIYFDKVLLDADQKRIDASWHKLAPHEGTILPPLQYGTAIDSDEEPADDDNEVVELSDDDE